MAFPERTQESGHTFSSRCAIHTGKDGPANEESPEQDGSESKRMFVTI